MIDDNKSHGALWFRAEQQRADVSVLLWLIHLYMLVQVLEGKDFYGLFARLTTQCTGSDFKHWQSN
jgi:hypothetical protein